MSKDMTAEQAARDIIETLHRLQCSDAACGDLRIAMAAKLAIFEIERLRADLKVMTEEHRLACEDRDLMQSERDEARRWICEQKASLTNHDAKWWAQVHTWDCFEREQGANDPSPESPLDRLARLDEEVGF